MAKFSIESWIDDNLSHVKTSGGSDERETNCPACGKVGTFYINAKSGKHICFKCDFRGMNLVNVISEVEEITRSEARKRLMRGVVDFKRVEAETLMEKISSLRSRGSAAKTESQLVEVPLPSEFIPVHNEKTGRWRFPSYLAKRGLKRETARKLKIGFCAGGLFAGRVIFPIVCPNGYSFTARDVTDQQQPKYRNPKGSGLHKLLFGWSSLIEGQDFMVVEGPMDAAMAIQHGFPAVALCGKNFGDEQCDMLRAKKLGAAVVILDPEEGLAPHNVGTRLLSFQEEVYLGLLPEGVDPGSSTLEQLSSAYDDAKRYKGGRASRVVGALMDSRKRTEKRYPSVKSKT